MYTFVPIWTALDSVFEGDAIIKDTNLSPSFCDARDRRICGFREIKDRKEKVQWLIVPKDSPTVRQGVPICSPRIFFFVQVGHSIRVQIHLHLYRVHTREFSLPGCHLVILRARHRKTVKYVRKLFISARSFENFIQKIQTLIWNLIYKAATYYK